MSDPRDDLAALIRDIYNHSDIQYEFPADDAADAILARWRLVPVEEQHRAADELTRHDQAAGHYGKWHDYDCGPLYGDKPHWHPTN